MLDIDLNRKSKMVEMILHIKLLSSKSMDQIGSILKLFNMKFKVLNKNLRFDTLM
jgi:hypothetical protein